MAIESYRSAKMQVEAAARSQLFPGIQIVIGIMRKAAGLGGLEFTKLEDLSLEAIQKNSKDNLAYLFEALVQDVGRIYSRLQEFESAEEVQCEALRNL
jgi:hypothetical protein